MHIAHSSPSDSSTRRFDIAAICDPFLFMVLIIVCGFLLSTATQNFWCSPFVQCCLWQSLQQYFTSLQREQEFRVMPVTPQLAHSGQADDTDFIFVVIFRFIGE
jgi:hypothetical protein